MNIGVAEQSMWNDISQCVSLEIAVQELINLDKNISCDSANLNNEVTNLVDKDIEETPSLSASYEVLSTWVSLLSLSLPSLLAQLLCI